MFTQFRFGSVPPYFNVLRILSPIAFFRAVYWRLAVLKGCAFSNFGERAHFDQVSWNSDDVWGEAKKKEKEKSSGGRSEAMFSLLPSPPPLMLCRG